MGICRVAQKTMARHKQGKLVGASSRLTVPGPMATQLHAQLPTPGGPNCPPHSPAAWQVGFHDNKLVRHVMVPKRLNDVVNRLNKTKQERYPDLKAEQEAYEKEQRSREKAQLQVGRGGVAWGAGVCLQHWRFGRAPALLRGALLLCL